jgi:signal transduction histidine kinase
MTSTDPVSILLVDDQPAKLLSYEAILEDLGENLIKAGSGSEALECLLKHDVAVVLMDVCMPGLDGFELASMIRKHPRFQRTPIILVSAIHFTDLDRLKGYNCGAVDYVSVPVIPEVLRAKVAVFADLHRKTQQLEDLNRSLEQRVAERTAEVEALLARLVEGDRRKDDFLALLAHELRNPLNPIRSAVQVLRTRGASDEELRWSEAVIDRQVDHLKRLIDDLLDISRITRNDLQLRTEQVSLNDVLMAAVETSRPLIEERRHELRLQLPERPVYLEADVVRLSQVFMNLLNNAAKYTPDGGRIVLDARFEESATGPAEIVVTVRDTGIGFSSDKLPHLFEMFFRAGDPLNRSQGGLGIGLSLVRSLVTMHQGRVEAESAGIGEGSTFTVRLPAASEQQARLPAAAPAPREMPPARRRILVVDDNKDSADSLALLLQFSGNEVEAAYDGLQALAAAESFRPEVILMDIGMPNLNGYEAARRIREQPWGRQMVLIAQTGWGQRDDRLRAVEAGFDAHLVKPVEPQSLIRMIAELQIGRDGRGDGKAAEREAAEERTGAEDRVAADWEALGRETLDPETLDPETSEMSGREMSDLETL